MIGTKIASLIVITWCLWPLPIAAAGQDPANNQARPLVVVTGEGVVRLPPDRAFVVMAAESRAKNPSEAQRANAKAMTNVQERLEQMGIKPPAVRTLGYDLQPEFEFANGRQTLRGYVARNSIEVTVDALDRVGDVIDASGSSGATTIQSVRFDVKSREASEREALKLAVADARLRAEAAAAGAGQRIDQIWRIEESRAVIQPPQPMRMREDALAVASTPIVAGDVEVRARVTLSAVIR
ncbi:MAG: SIMPL domain-containing protein [Vicinamibacterales bacterium]